jgi:hypothetical protein
MMLSHIMYQYSQTRRLTALEFAASAAIPGGLTAL